MGDKHGCRSIRCPSPNNFIEGDGYGIVIPIIRAESLSLNVKIHPLLMNLLSRRRPSQNLICVPPNHYLEGGQDNKCLPIISLVPLKKNRSSPMVISSQTALPI